MNRNFLSKRIFYWSDGTPVLFTSWSRQLMHLDSRDKCTIIDLWKTTDDYVLNFGDCDQQHSVYFLCKSSKPKSDKHRMNLPFFNSGDLTNSTNFKCKSGDFITQFAICDQIVDCQDGTDEENCSYTGKAYVGAADVIFLLDDSEDISKTMFVDQKYFVNSIISNLDIGENMVAVGIMTAFGDKIELVPFKGKPLLQVIVNAIRQSSRPQTEYIIQGIKRAQSSFDTYGRSGLPKVLFIMTENRSENASKVLQEAKKAEADGVKIIIISFGNGETLSGLWSSFETVGFPVYEYNEFQVATLKTLIPTGCKGSIEADCTGKFKCGSCGCIPYSMYCDNVMDCIDGSDEICDFGAVSSEEWQCEDGRIIPSAGKCNGSFECFDKSDENDCSDCSTAIQEKQFWCGLERSCLPQERVCDGFQDCSSSEHEEAACVPDSLESCKEWWKLGYRERRLYKLKDDAGETVTAECDFDSLQSTGKIKTIFHNIDFHPTGKLWKADQAKIEYEGYDFIKRFTSLSGQLCTQTFTQTCLPNRLWIANELDLRYHTEYWDCLCIKLTVYSSDSHGTTFNSCSNATEILITESFIQIDRMWNFQIEGFLPQTIRRREKKTLSLYLDPITCVEDASSLNEEHRVIICERGKPVSADVACLYDFDDKGFIIGCRDMSHLHNCEKFDCPPGYAKCPESFCIAARFFCDGQVDCPSGEDEDACSNTDKPQCNGYYRCQGTAVCVPPHQVCDGRIHCPKGDDERLCAFRCPEQCHCAGYEVTCTIVQNANLSNELVHFPQNSRKVDLSNSQLHVHGFPYVILPYVGHFNLSRCRLHEIRVGVFSSMSNLLVLDLSKNMFTSLQSGTFQGLKKLKQLILSDNMHLVHIEPGVFEDLVTIKHLKISCTNIQYLMKNAFGGLIELNTLDISHNAIATVDDNSFQGLPSLTLLDIRRNTVTNFGKGIFTSVDSLIYLKTDEYMFCCLKPKTVSVGNCTPQADEFSSCKDLMRNEAPRFLLWIIGILALAGNVLSLLYRIFFDRKRLKIGYGVFVTNLTIADFLMGIYLLIIAGADIHYRHRYIWNDKVWRHSMPCKLAGVLSTVSSEASVCFILLITLDRILVIRYPFGYLKFTTRLAVIVSLIAWTIVVLLACLPFTLKFYFEEKFYSKNAVCLALPLTRRRPAGWEYSISVFIVFNFLTFLMIAIGQASIYQAVKASGKAAKIQKRKDDLVIARNLLLVVATDFLCWFPIGVMGIMALAGTTIPGEVYVWATVLILPINSALNPFLYTFSAIIRKKQFVPNIDEQSGTCVTDTSILTNVLNYGHFYSKNFVDRFRKTRQLTSLKTYLDERRIISKNIVQQVAVLLTKHVEFLHGVDLTVNGEIRTEDVILTMNGESVTDIGLCISPKQITKEDDTVTDIKRVGNLVKNLLETYDNGSHSTRKPCAIDDTLEAETLL